MTRRSDAIVLAALVVIWIVGGVWFVLEATEQLDKKRWCRDNGGILISNTCIDRNSVIDP